MRRQAFLVVLLLMVGCGDGISTYTPAPAPRAPQGGDTPQQNAATPVTDAQYTGRFEGSLDAADCRSAGGWARNIDQPTIAIQVAIYDGTTLLSIVSAELFRPDLAAAGKDEAKHGFVYMMPDVIRDGATHAISARVEGANFLLYGNPISVTCK